MKISIVMPVYNVSEYLPKAIDSVLKQTFKDFELLLIDDGSKDDSGKICDEYAKKDSRINAGMFAKVKLYTSKYSGEIVVPSDAVVSDDEYSYVFVIDENCVAEKRTVKTGKSVDAKVQILEGLQSGERVIVEGMLSVSDGIKVNDLSSEKVNQ